MYTVKVFDSDYGFYRESIHINQALAVKRVEALEANGHIAFIDGGI